MKLGVIGLWHLGTVTAACAAAAGIRTIGIDDDPTNVERLGRGEPPVFEPGLAELVKQGLATGTLSFAAAGPVLGDIDVLWACHDTPVDDADRADVEFVVRKLEATFAYLQDQTVVLVSAQLPVGTVAALERSFASVARGRTVSFACSPENLRLGHAIEIFRNPGRIVVGVRDLRAREDPAANSVPLLRKFDLDVGRDRGDRQARPQRLPRGLRRLHQRARRHMREGRRRRDRCREGTA